MIRFSSAFIGLLCSVALAQQPTLQCDDIDTKSCEGFHRARPDLCTDPTFSQSMCKRFCGNCPLECYSCDHPVNHPSECNTTETCGPAMRCVTKHLRAMDGHHEYLMRCESQELCNIFVDGFGKRRVVADDDMSAGDRERFDRDVILNCCDKDLCNFEIEPTTTTTTTSTTTTTTTTTTAAPLTTTAQRTHSCMKDIVFVIQNYQSIKTDSWENFMYQIVSQIDVGPTGAHVAVVQDSRTLWNLDRYQTKSEVLQAIRHQRHHTTNGHFNDAIQTVTSSILAGHNGDRKQADNVVVILEYGQSHEPIFSTYAASSHLHSVSSDVVMVAVGPGIDSRQLSLLATDRHHIFTESHFQDLDGIVQNVVNVICS